MLAANGLQNLLDSSQQQMLQAALLSLKKIGEAKVEEGKISILPGEIRRQIREGTASYLNDYKNSPEALKKEFSLATILEAFQKELDDPKITIKSALDNFGKNTAVQEGNRSARDNSFRNYLFAFRSDEIVSNAILLDEKQEVDVRDAGMCRADYEFINQVFEKKYPLDFKLDANATIEDIRKIIINLVDRYVIAAFAWSKVTNQQLNEEMALKYERLQGPLKEGVLSLSAAFDIILDDFKSTTLKHECRFRDVCSNLKNGVLQNLNKMLTQDIHECYKTGLNKSVKYFTKERFNVDAENKDLRSVEGITSIASLIEFLLEYQKLKCKREGILFDCTLFMIMEPEYELEFKIKGITNYYNNESGLRCVTDFVKGRCIEFLEKSKQSSSRFQIKINNRSHYTVVDVQLDRDSQSNAMKKKCFIMDAAQDPRLYAVYHVFSDQGFKVYIAGKDSEAIQLDKFSCSIFAYGLAVASSKDFGLFDLLEQKKEPEEKLEKEKAKEGDEEEEEIKNDELPKFVSWLNLPGQYVRNAQSASFHHDYEEKHDTSKMIVTSGGESYAAYKNKCMKFNSFRQKNHNTGTLMEMLFYGEAIEALLANSASDVFFLGHGQIEKLSENFEFSPKQKKEDQPANTVTLTRG